MKKLIAFAFAALFTACVFADTETVNGVRWTYFISNGVATIGNGYSAAIPTSTGGAIVIPSALGGYPVKNIGGYAFYNCSSLASVTIPDGVSKIGVSAFCYCSSLTSVMIPESMTEIMAGAFSGCSYLREVHITNLSKWCEILFNSSDANPCCYAHSLYVNGVVVQDLVIPENVTSLRSYVFYNCDSLMSVTIPDGVAVIGYCAFYGCRNLTSITIPNSVTEIGWNAFDGCGSLTSVTIPSSVLTIGEHAFANCARIVAVSISVQSGFSAKSLFPDAYTKIERFVIQEGSLEISQNSFEGCSSLTTVTIPEGVISIGTDAFYGCESLSSVMIPEGVTTIGDCAFEYCSSLTSVTIPNSVKTIGVSAFRYCSLIKQVCVPSSFVMSSLFPDAYQQIESVTIPVGETTIVSYAFRYCKSLTSVMIPNSVTTIGEQAFRDCSQLISISFPDSVTSIGADAIAGTPYYNNLPDGLIIIGAILYKIKGDCPSEVVIPNGVTTIGDSAFYSRKSLVSVLIPDSVIVIGSSAFSQCSSLTSVTIPDSVTKIGRSAFSGCSALTSIAIPDGIAEIERSLFWGCTSLETVKIPLSVHTIGEYAFNQCDTIKSVIVPGNFTITAIFPNSIAAITNATIVEGTTNIASSIFAGCVSLTDVTIPEGVTVIPGRAFAGCSALASITISNSVTEIGYEAFYGCSSLESVIVSENVTTIGERAFSGCSSINSVMIPDSVTAIGSSAFYGCYSLTSVYIDDISRLCTIKFGNENANPFRYAHQLYLNGEEVVELTIPDDVCAISQYAFAGCNVKRVVVHDAVESIGLGAFIGCDKIESIRLPFIGTDKHREKESNDDDGCMDVFGSIFGYHQSGTKPADGVLQYERPGQYYSYYIPDSLTNVEVSCVQRIPRCAFRNCSKIVSLKIHRVNSIGHSAFDGCLALESIDIEGPLTDWLRIDFENRSSNPLTVGAKVETASGAIGGEIEIPDDIDIVKQYAFVGSEDITSVVFHQGVTNVANTAFAEVPNITSVTIPACVKSLAETFPASYTKIKEVTILDGVTEIAANAFSGCVALEKIRIPASVKTIGANAFIGCASIKEVEVPHWVNSASVFAASKNGITKVHLVGSSGVVPNSAYAGFGALSEVVIDDGVTALGSSVFQNCKSLTEIDIPQSVTSMGGSVFSGCSALMDVEMKGDAPDIGYNIFDGTPKRMIVSVPNNSIGWNGSVSTNLPETWGGRLVTHSSETILWPGSNEGPTVAKYVTVTNVVVHYVVNSIQPEFAKPVSEDTGFVNVIAEVKGNNVAVPETWAESYPKFTATFGTDFTKALTKKSGKIAADGREMLVWEDYVAGTDPTDPNDKFTAAMTIVDGKPVVSWTPELDAERAAMRKYTTYGKVKLTDKEWVVVPEGRASDYNFFKVSVEMK